jgi:transposase InsO family protein
MHPSAVHRVLVRHGMSRLSDIDRAIREPIRRIEMSRPDELVHVDVKKLGRIPKGGGWRVNGRAAEKDCWRKTRVGYAFVHSAVDGYSLLAYSEALDNEQGSTAAAFWRRAQEFLADQGIVVDRVLTGSGSCYRSHDFRRALGDADHTLTPPYRPQTNGKVERFQPHPARRVGLRQALDLRRPAHQSACPLTPYLQPSPAPDCYRTTAGEPCRQCLGTLHLDSGGST